MKVKKYLITQKDGFTIMELVVVLSIFAILAVVAMPSLVATLPKKRVNHIARAIVADLHWIRMKAVNENVNTYYMSVDNINSNFTLFNDNVVTNGQLDNNELIRTTNIKDIYTTIQLGTVAGITDPAGGVILFPNSVSLNYTSQGTITQPAYVYIRPYNDTTGENLRAVQISRSGNIKVWAYNTTTAQWGQ